MAPFRLIVRRVSTIGLVTVLATTAGVVVTAGAGASTPTAIVRTSGAALNVRSAPNTSSKVLRRLPNKSSVTLDCSTTGPAVTSPGGVKTKLWYRTTKGGYLSDAFLKTGSNSSITRACVSETGRTWGSTRMTNPGAAGNCTWGAYEYFKRQTGVYPDLRGNAKDIAASARKTGWTVVLPAQAHSIVVFQPGVYWANARYGHTAWVTSTERRSDGVYVNIVEMNWRGLGVWSTRTIKDIHGMSYILAPS